MRIRSARRSIVGIALAAAMATLLTGCIAFATAQPAVDAFRAYALTLDGVAAVETTMEEPSNRANPFVTDSDAVVLVTLQDEAWERTLEPVSEALVTWLATEQEDSTTSLAVAIAFPAGALALSDADTTAGRVALVHEALADSGIVGIEIGWDSGYATSAGNADTEVVLVRELTTPVSSVATAWLPLLEEYEWLGIASEFTRPADADGVTDASLGARELRLRSGSSDLDTYLEWLDAVDGSASVIGWTARERDVVIALSADADSAGEEAALRALPGFEVLTSLTIVQGDREYEVVG